MKNTAPNQIIQRNRYGDSEEVEVIQCPTPTISYIVNGKLALHTHQGVTQLYAGELFVLHKGRHYVEHYSMEGRLYEEILFSPSESLLITILTELPLFTDLRPLPPQSPTPAVPHQSADRILTSFMNGIREYLNGDILDRCGPMVRMKTNELIYLLLTNNYSTLVTALHQLCTQKRIPIGEFALEHILADKHLAELAEEYGLSLSAFKKEFRERLGATPHRWFMTKRLEMASRLLLTTDDQVKAIAHTCHFISTSHFIRLFRNQYKLSPAKFRLAHQQAEWQEPNKEQNSLKNE